MIRQHQRNGLTYLDVLVGICLFTLTLAAVAPVTAQLRERHLRIQCAANLRKIGQGLMFYANYNKGAYPRTRYDSADAAPLNFYTGATSPHPFAKEGAPLPNDVTAAIYMLVRETSPERTAELSRQQEPLVDGAREDFGLDPKHFLCPSVIYARLDESSRVAADTRIDEMFAAAEQADKARRPRSFTADWVDNPPWAKDRLARSNFPGPAELHYSIALMYPPAAAIAKGYKFHSGVVADMAIMADINPGHADLRKATQERGALAKILQNVNSPNHGGEGQNVMFNDGHVEWFITPLAGAEKDNIYTHGRTTRTSGGEGIAGPLDWPLDSVLLPTASQKPTGPADNRKKSTSAAIIKSFPLPASAPRPVVGDPACPHACRFSLCVLCASAVNSSYAFVAFRRSSASMN